MVNSNAVYGPPVWKAARLPSIGQKNIAKPVKVTLHTVPRSEEVIDQTRMIHGEKALVIRKPGRLSGERIIHQDNERDFRYLLSQSYDQRHLRDKRASVRERGQTGAADSVGVRTAAVIDREQRSTGPGLENHDVGNRIPRGSAGVKVKRITGGGLRITDGRSDQNRQ